MFISPDATASVNCRNEINLALDEGKPFHICSFKRIEAPAWTQASNGRLAGDLSFQIDQRPVRQESSGRRLNLFLKKGVMQSSWNRVVHAEDRRGRYAQTKFIEVCVYSFASLVNCA